MSPPLSPRARALRHARRFPRAYWTLVAGSSVQNLGLGLFLPYTGLYLIGDVGASPAAVGVVLALFAFAGLAATPAGGVLADRVGRRPVMLAGIAGCGVAAIAFGLVSSIVAVGVLAVCWSLAESVFRPA